MHMIDLTLGQHFYLLDRGELILIEVRRSGDHASRVALAIHAPPSVKVLRGEVQDLTKANSQPTEP